ncbi:MAG TPA: oligosaccharide flippase family protein [Candidatus Eisenbacteria bacterium]|nr:oligosaccharide flippase family protein [Candidatus Eisenbacteria bacterium]
MEELDIAAVIHRSIHGVFALVTRTLFIQIVGFTVNFLLTIYLSPSVFGVYFVVTAVIAFLAYFSDIGLAAALIQKKEKLTSEDLSTTFTIQQVLVVSACLVALILSQFFASFYKLDMNGYVLLVSLIIAFFLSSLKTIPSILLERNLRFEKLVIPQIVETLAFNLVALFFAMKGYGVASFTYAVLARGVSGLIAIYIISPWKIRLGFSLPTAKRLLLYGIPFQANSFLALLKDDLLIAYVGKVLPLSQVGYIGFAQKWAFTPLRLISDNIIRIAFPSFARLQHDAHHLGKAIEKALFATSFFIFPALVGLFMLAPSFIEVIPKYHKWEPAILSLGFFAMNAAVSAISTPLTNVLNAVGKIKVTLYLMILWTILTWVLTPLAIYWYGFNGFAGVSALISLTVILVVFVTKKYIAFSIKPVIVPTISSLLMLVLLFFGNQLLGKTILSIGILIVSGALLYFASCFLLARQSLMEDIALIRKQFVQS